MLRAAVLLGLVGLWLAGPADAAGSRRAAKPSAGTAVTPATGPAAPDDDLYRRRGYGTGGLTFGLGRQGGTSMAGACADLSFTHPRSCGPRANYGIYGNGLGYGFGL